MQDIAFAYASAAVFDVFEQEGFARFSSAIPPRRVFSVKLANAGIAAPATVTLSSVNAICSRASSPS